jgi:hypothetical protein
MEALTSRNPMGLHSCYKNNFTFFTPRVHRTYCSSIIISFNAALLNHNTLPNDYIMQVFNGERIRYGVQLNIALLAMLAARRTPSYFCSQLSVIQQPRETWKNDIIWTLKYVDNPALNCNPWVPWTWNSTCDKLAQICMTTNNDPMNTIYSSKND